MKIGMLKQILCEGAMSVLPECFMRMDIMSDWGMLTLPSTVKPKPFDEI